jgi:hypothetical protein
MLRNQLAVDGSLSAAVKEGSGYGFHALDSRVGESGGGAIGGATGCTSYADGVVGSGPQLKRLFNRRTTPHQVSNPWIQNSRKKCNYSDRLDSA